MPTTYPTDTARAPAWAPRLYHDFAAWLANQPNGSLGDFELRAADATVWDEWSAAQRAQIKERAFTCMTLPDGADVLLVRSADEPPYPVVLLGSEGQIDVLADSVEQFLHQVAKGETSVMELDEEDSSGRKRLRQWLTRRKITLPEARAFDFEAWLAGQPIRGARKAAPAPAAGMSFDGDAEALERLQFDPVLVELISMIGRRSDDPVLIDFMTTTVGKKCPPTLREDKWVTWSRWKINLLFNPHAKNAKYPRVANGKSAVPYLTVLDMTSATLKPFEAQNRLTRSEAAARFGHAKYDASCVPLIPARDVVLRFYGYTIYICIETDEKLRLAEFF